MTSANLSDALVRVHSVVIEPNILIESKIEHGGCKKQLSRKQWYHNRKKVARLCRKLEEARRLVMEAMLAEIFLVQLLPFHAVD